MQPLDAKTFSFDSVDNTTCTSTTSILLPAVDNWRTILNARSVSRQSGDNHIRDSSKSYPNNLILDCETSNTQCSENDIQWLVPPNTNINCVKSSINDHTWFSLTYLDYNLASTSNQIEISTTTQVQVNNDNLVYASGIIIFLLTITLVLTAFKKYD